MPARGSKQTLEKKVKPKYEKIDTSALPPLYKCTCCGKTVQDPEGKFFKVVQNSLYKANDGYSNVCTYCCDDYFARMREKYKDEKMALLMTCAEMGWYFSEATYIKMKEKDPQDIRLGDYVKRLNLSQNKDLTFVDYVISSINNEQFLRSKEEVNQQMESEWTKEEQKNKQEMKIGNIEFGPRPVFLAPMEDVTDIGFRLLCKRFGASMVYTEFVSAEALVRSVKSTLNKLVISDIERPVGIQIYGRDVASMVEAAKIVEEAKPDIIDINFGCPVKKVAGKGAGAGMLQNIPLLLDITREVVKAVNIPVTVKTRLGWTADNIIIEDLAEQLQDCGIAALTIHGRTRSQMYTGEADWNPIAAVKRNPRITIPVIGNGDICSPEDVEHAFDEYGVDAVMIGRATFGRPWIFKEINDYLERREADPMMDNHWKLEVLKEQLHINVERIDEYRGILHTRRHLAASPIFKGIPNFRDTRIAMLRATTVEELQSIFDDITAKFF